MKLANLTTLIAVTGAALFVTAGPASAMDWTYGTSFGHTSYKDNGDVVSVCDDAANGEGVKGRISVQQPDGSYSAWPWIYNGGGKGTCKSVTQDVARESANLKLTICRSNGSSGTPFDCRTSPPSYGG